MRITLESPEMRPKSAEPCLNFIADAQATALLHRFKCSLQETEMVSLPFLKITDGWCSFGGFLVTSSITPILTKLLKTRKWLNNDTSFSLLIMSDIMNFSFQTVKLQSFLKELLPFWILYSSSDSLNRFDEESSRPWRGREVIGQCLFELSNISKKVQKMFLYALSFYYLLVALHCPSLQSHFLFLISTGQSLHFVPPHTPLYGSTFMNL